MSHGSNHELVRDDTLNRTENAGKDNLMKRIISTLLAILLTLSFALAEGEAPGLQEGIEWGMSVDEVQAVVGAYYQAAEKDYLAILLRRNAFVYGADADIAYFFYFGKLVSMGYDINMDEVNINAIFHAMLASYGLPKTLDVNRLNSITGSLFPEFIIDDLEDGRSFSFQAADGTYIVWLVEDSSLELMFFAEDLITEIYESEGKDVVTADQNSPTLEFDESEQEDGIQR